MSITASATAPDETLLPAKSDNCSTSTSNYQDCIQRIRTLVDDNRMSGLQILVVLICFVLNMLDGMDVVLMSYAAPVLAQDWSIQPAALGVVFSAALVGMTFGCLAIAPYADVIGRRRMIMIAIFIIASGMLLSGLSQSVIQLAAARIYTGLGVGAILASMASMASEYSSEKHRNFCVSLVQAGFPIGAVLTGFTSAAIMPDHGWQPMFIVAAAMTAIMLPLVYFLMPESLEFLAKRQPKGAFTAINKTLSRMKAPVLQSLPEKPDDAHHKTSVKALFQGTRQFSTIMLWTGVFLGFFTLYFVISWIPKIAVDAGLPLEKGIYAGTAYNLGSFVGSIFLGWISARFGLQRMIFAFFTLAAITLIIFGTTQMSVFFILLTAFIIGITLNGGFNGFWPTAARLYPTEIRTTGIGWAVGAGRAGAVLGPMVGGYLLQSGAGLATTFVVFAVPLVLAGIAALNIRSKDFA
ncbi:MFS transporter [Aestuariicella hydrocarbonica]|uniref:MFS transporter n=1 Tax=Pseudomaricurvus hydrocarbonicus TaxID=1470433 RepID=A0A9E5K114_9GAMM|nr:MFS transporter [Aestuariicella hydrocarbonica]NHO66797.1 MFS transporter [Aestuariicella hydrocarbonica]